MIMRSQQKWFAAGAIGAALSVALGAIGAHALKGWVAEAYPDDSLRRLETWETAARYLMYSSFAVMLCSVGSNVSARHAKIVSLLSAAGAVLFSGSLFVYVLADIKALMPIVPIGGLCMILSWVLIAYFSILGNKKGQGNEH